MLLPPFAFLSPNAQLADPSKVRIFHGSNSGLSASVSDWMLWRKPRGCSLFLFTLWSGGAGGGGGFSRSASNPGGGGGGGGSGVPIYLSVAAPLVPDLLHIRVGQGGPGGAAGVAGTGGGNTYVCVTPSTGAGLIFLLATNGAAINTNGTASAGGTAGLSTTGFVANLLGSFVGAIVAPAFAGGQSAGAGGAHTGAVGANGGNGAGNFQGGAGGGGTTSADFAGGSITGVGLMPTISGGAAGSNNGADGTTLWSPFVSVGGAGGGSSNTGIGGNGGNAGRCCGGGGGGAGTTGGTGGRGGDGLVIIVGI